MSIHTYPSETKHRAAESATTGVGSQLGGFKFKGHPLPAVHQGNKVIRIIGIPKQTIQLYDETADSWHQTNHQNSKSNTVHSTNQDEYSQGSLRENSKHRVMNLCGIRHTPMHQPRVSLSGLI